jgi:hypothetical protein
MCKNTGHFCSKICWEKSFLHSWLVVLYVGLLFALQMSIMMATHAHSMDCLLFKCQWVYYTNRMLFFVETVYEKSHSKVLCLIFTSCCCLSTVFVLCCSHQQCVTSLLLLTSFLFSTLDTTKLTTIERIFQLVFTRFLHQNLMFCTNPT